MTVNITVANKRKVGNRGEYIGRPSPLGNPFTSKDHGGGIRVASVQESIDRYAAWLDGEIAVSNPKVCNELNRLAAIAAEHPLTLVCWCAPGPCHGDIIKQRLEEALK